MFKVHGFGEASELLAFVKALDAQFRENALDSVGGLLVMTRVGMAWAGVGRAGKGSGAHSGITKVPVSVHSLEGHRHGFP